LATIMALKELGLSLPEIRQAVGRAASGENRRLLLQRLKSEVQHSIEESARSLSWIDAAIEELNRSSHPPAVMVKRRPPVRVASIRSKIETYPEILTLEHDLLRALPEECVGELHGVLWHRCADSGGLEGEPFVELKREAPGNRGYELKQLPPATLACAYSGAGDDESEQAYDAIRRWMHVRGYRLGGAKREISRGPMLEIQFPLK
jgi:effector-binding domain-containing protein